MEVCLDNAVTSHPKPERVIQAVARYMRDVGASAGRGTYRKALEAERVVYEAREAEEPGPSRRLRVAPA